VGKTKVAAEKPAFTREKAWNGLKIERKQGATIKRGKGLWKKYHTKTESQFSKQGTEGGVKGR